VSEKSQHRPFAVQGRIGADADFRAVAGRRDPSFLGNIAAIGQQIGQHFQSRDDRRTGSERKFPQRLQHTVVAEPDFQTLERRLQMGVAGLHPPGKVQQLLDEFGGVGVGFRTQVTDPFQDRRPLVGQIQVFFLGRRAVAVGGGG